MRKEDPEVYFNVLSSHAKFVYHHRNIQIENIDPIQFSKDLQQNLQKHPHIHRIYVDAAKAKANISTTDEHYLSVCDWVDKQLSKVNLSYKPNRVQRLNGSVHTQKSKGTRYAHLFQDDHSTLSEAVALILARSKHPEVMHGHAGCLSKSLTRPKAKNSLPSQLKAKQTQLTQETVITAETDNINTMISDAITKFEKEQTMKLENITKEMNAKMSQLEESIKQIVHKVIEATYQSLTKSEIFVTKEDNLVLQLEVASINKKMDALMEALTQSNTSVATSPPRKNQRTNHLPQESSAPLISDVAMSEREG